MIYTVSTQRLGKTAVGLCTAYMAMKRNFPITLYLIFGWTQLGLHIARMAVTTYFFTLVNVINSVHVCINVNLKGLCISPIIFTPGCHNSKPCQVPQ